MVIPCRWCWREFKAFFWTIINNLIFIWLFIKRICQTILIKNLKMFKMSWISILRRCCFICIICSPYLLTALYQSIIIWFILIFQTQQVFVIFSKLRGQQICHFFNRITIIIPIYFILLIVFLKFYLWYIIIRNIKTIFSLKMVDVTDSLL